MSAPHPPRDPYWCDPHPPSSHPLPRDGRRNCGVLERQIHRQWDPAKGLPPADLIHVIDRLATLPADIASRLAAELDGLWVGDGNVPDLDALQYLKGC